MTRMRWLLMGVLLCFAKTATAGAGPWVVGAGSSSLFASIEAQRLNTLSTQTETGSVEVDVGEGLSSQGLQVIGTYGVHNRTEIELAVPWRRNYANRPDDALCDALGLGACRTTQGIGLVNARVKALLIDELYGSPVSLSVSLNSRYGAFTAEERARITNLGEGTFDVGPSVSVGRSSALPRGGDWSAYVEGGWLYRFANTDSFPNFSDPVPAGEFFGEAKAFVSPGQGQIGFGPHLMGLWRPGGLDWYELEASGGLTDLDRFSALAVQNVRAGGILLLRGPYGATLVTSMLHTIHARNNPTDSLFFSIGIGFNRAPST